MYKQKLLITGATGFVGGFLTEEAVNRGYDVVVSVRKSSDLSYIKHLPISYTELNLNSPEELIRQIELIKPDFIIHNAGLTKAKTQDELDKVNAEFSLNFAQASLSLGDALKKFLFVSSLAAFGPAELQPDFIVKAESLPQPVTMYGKSKLKAEKLLTELSSLPLLTIRPTAVYGPREKDLYLVYKTINQGLQIHIGDGSQQLTFIYVVDLVNYMLDLLKSKQTHKSYFATDGELYTSKQFNELIGRNLGRKTLKFGLPLPLLKVGAYASEFIGMWSNQTPTLNIDKLNEITAKSWNCDVEPLVLETNYNPRYKLEKGIAETITWYRENRWL